MRVAATGNFAVVMLALLLSCSQPNMETEKSWLSFRCPNGQIVRARFEAQDQFVRMQFEGWDLRLPHVISGSGARYSDGKTTFWNKGEQRAYGSG